MKGEFPAAIIKLDENANSVPGGILKSPDNIGGLVFAKDAQDRNGLQYNKGFAICLT